MSRRLENKIAVITGGTSGIGLATAKLFLREGATVVLTGSSEGSVAAARAELGEAAEVVRSDAGDVAAIARLFAEVGARHGGIDVLFLNAGIVRVGTLDALDEVAFDEQVRINFKGPWFALKHAIPHLRDGASVLLNTTALQTRGWAGMSVYTATKAALRTLARNASAELAARGIRVNAVSPGPIETPIFGKLGLSEIELQEFASQALQRVTAGRFGQPDEVAQAALFLASADSAYVVGAELTVDGGFAQI